MRRSPSLFRSLDDSRTCDNICGNLHECYVQKNVEEGMKPEHRILNKDIVANDYKQLLHSYWDTKIQNFSVTDQGTSFTKLARSIFHIIMLNMNNKNVFKIMLTVFAFRASTNISKCHYHLH